MSDPFRFVVVPKATGDVRIAAERVAVVAYGYAAARDLDGSVPDKEVAALAAHGLLLAPLPAALGGTSLGMSGETAFALRDVLRKIGGASLSVARLFEGHVNAVRLTTRFGTAEQLSRIAREVEAGRMSAVWNAQTGAGLRFDGKTLAGQKIYCSGLGLVHRPLLTANGPQGFVMLMPDVSRAVCDLSAWTPLGMRASLSGTCDFTGIVVADDECIGHAGDYYAAPLFAGGAWRVLAAQLGALERLLFLYRTQIKARNRHEDPVQRARFGETVALLETARLWVTRSASFAENPNQDAAETAAFVNLARRSFEQAALGTIERIERGLGLSAMVSPNPIERIIRDLTTYLRQPFPDAALDAAAVWALEDRPMHRNMGDT